MRLMDAVAPKRVTIGASAPASWTVDPNALMCAIERLGLKSPVVVHTTRGRGGRRKSGLHRYEHGAHVISVVCHETREDASRVLWHELEHACQREQLGEQYHVDYRAETRAHGGGHAGYMANRFEVAARRAERRHDVWFPLTLTGRAR